LLGRAEETHTRTSLGIVVVRPMLRPSIFWLQVRRIICWASLAATLQTSSGAREGSGEVKTGSWS
jgi:hypothetical protein